MGCRADPAPDTGEAGFTLIELLITMLVLAVGGLAIVGAMSSSILVADAHRGMAEGEVVARDFVEAVRDNAASLDPWPVCPTAAQLDPGFTAPGWTARFVGVGAPTPQVRYWLPGAGTSSETWTPNRSQCVARYNLLCGTGSVPPDLAASCDPGVVRVDLEIENDRDDVAETVVRTSAVIRRSDGS